MRLQRMLGHLTTLVPADAEQGARHRLRRRRHGRRRVDRSRRSRRRRSPRSSRSCRASVSTYFAEHNFDVVSNPKVHVHIDDARHFLLTTDEKFDAITSDPLDPWVKGAATLYTREFFELVEGAPEPGRRRDAVRAALREQRRGGQERDRHVLRGVPERHGLRQHVQRRRATTWCCSGRSRRRTIDLDAMRGAAQAPRVRAGGAVAARDRHELGGRPLRDLRRTARRTSRRGWPTRRSTATATCGCSTWRAAG